MVNNKAFLLFFTMIALLFSAFIFSLSQPEVHALQKNVAQPAAAVLEDGTQEMRYAVSVDEVPFMVSVAGNPKDRTQGLSGVQELPQGEGKLFVFEQSDTYGFWMKDMNFPIDMIWFDEDGVLVHVAHNVAPESFPELFAPAEPALYVLEVNTGVAATENFNTDSQLVLGTELQNCLKEGCFIE
jgi:uncharacterized membrane protein (UPF0127 family)